jgi:hypothetical protein
VPGAEVELVRGSGGIYDIYKGDELVFSKFDAGRFPSSDDEILSKL